MQKNAETENPIDIYNHHLKLLNKEIERLKKQSRYFSLFRVLSFLLILFLAYFSWTNQAYWQFPFLLITISIFAILVKKQVNCDNEIIFKEALKKHIIKELEALEGNFSSFENGNEFLNFDHPYAFDLDIFGQNSLFQRCNRAFSDGGKRKTADYLLQPILDANTILSRQKLFAELNQKFEFVWQWLALSSLYPFSNKKMEQIKLWLNAKSNFEPSKTFQFFIRFFPVLTVSTWLAYGFDFLPYQIPVLLSSIQLFVSYFNAKKINEIHQNLNDKFQLFQNISAQILLFEKQNFEQEILKNWQQKTSFDNKKASEILAELSNIMKRFDNRYNVFVIFVLNALFFYEIKTVLKLNNWKNKYANSLDIWFNLIFEVEALSSLATFNFNHPNFSLPQIENKVNFIKTEELSHPFISPKKSVSNNFEMEGKGQYFIVTGSNMSGKSTFLRTLGLNSVLAGIGLNVCAKMYAFSPKEIYTSMRINDSLQENESYFYAEIKRLKKITERAEETEPALILLDEILRGTNSLDKHKGSEALMQKLVQLNSSGVLATHDLSLGKLAEENPKQFTNKCFESQVLNNELYFDYTMRDGVCQNLNAVFLMQKMGIMS